MRYLITFIIVFLVNFSFVHGLAIEDNLNKIRDNLKTIENNQKNRNLLNKMYPVGSIYISTSSTNPSSLVGGTWQAYAQGRTLIGIDGSSYKTASATGGDAIKTISTSNMRSHNHTSAISGTVKSTFKGTSKATSSAGGHKHSFPFNISGNESTGYALSRDGNGYQGRIITTTASKRTTTVTQGSHNHSVSVSGTVKSTFKGSTGTTTAVGSGTSVDFRNPYITVYIWRRTA